MINYFDAAEKTLRSRGVLETALENLERRRDYRTKRPGGVSVAGLLETLCKRRRGERRSFGVP